MPVLKKPIASIHKTPLPAFPKNPNASARGKAAAHRLAAD